MMKSKTSFFNGTVLLKDITRFCPVWALYLVYGLLWAMSAFASDIAWGVRDILRSMTSFGPLNLIYGFIVAVMLFGDLFKSRLCNGLHALAPRRESWFATHCLAGLLFSLVPNLIIAILITLYSSGGVWFLGLAWLLIMTLQYLFFFGLGVFSVMCSGNRFAATAVYGLINFGSLIVRWFVVTFYEPQLYGVQISETIFQILCPAVQILGLDFNSLERLVHHQLEYKYGYDAIIGGADFVDGFAEWYMLTIGILGLVLLALALLLYRRRKLECAGDLMAFRWMRPVFAVVFTLTVGALFEMIGSGMIGQEQVFLWIGILIGYFVGQMLLQRTVAVFKLKTFAGCAAVAVALVLSILLAMLDPLGIERWVPNPDAVEAVSISDSWYSSIYNDSVYYDDQEYDNPALIHALVDVHRTVLEEGEVSNTGSAKLYRLRLTYKMKNGHEVSRVYRYYGNSEVYRKLQQFYCMPEKVLNYSDWEDYLDSIISVSVDSGIVTGKLSGEEARQLMSAVKADFEDGAFLAGGASPGKYCSLVIVTDTDRNIAKYLSVTYGCDNTIAWLKENMKKD